MSDHCRYWHDLYGSCERPEGHGGAHARVPGGSTRPNLWANDDEPDEPSRDDLKATLRVHLGAMQSLSRALDECNAERNELAAEVDRLRSGLSALLAEEAS